MAKTYQKKNTKKTKIRLSPEEAQEVYRKEFTDSRGNKMNFIFDFKFQKPSDPTIEWNRQYNKGKD